MVALSDVRTSFAFDFTAIQPHHDHDRISRFADYLLENYLTEDAVFLTSLWAESGDSLGNAVCYLIHQQYLDALKFCSSFKVMLL